MADPLTDGTEALFALPRSLIDTDLYKVLLATLSAQNSWIRTDYMHYSSRCSRLFCAIFQMPRRLIVSLIAIKTYTSLVYAMSAI